MYKDKSLENIRFEIESNILFIMQKFLSEPIDFIGEDTFQPKIFRLKLEKK